MGLCVPNFHLVNYVYNLRQLPTYIENMRALLLGDLSAFARKSRQILGRGSPEGTLL